MIKEYVLRNIKNKIEINLLKWFDLKNYIYVYILLS